MLPHMPLAPVSAYTRELPAQRVPHLHLFIHYHCVCVQPLHTYLHALLSSGLTAKCGFDTGRQGSGRQARSWSSCEQRSQETVKSGGLNIGGVSQVQQLYSSLDTVSGQASVGGLMTRDIGGIVGRVVSSCCVVTVSVVWLCG